MKKIIFGCGKMGIKALAQYGKENVAFFCDNAKEKWGTNINGIKVISFDELVEIHSMYEILVTPINNFTIVAQLDSCNIKNYSIYISEEQSIITKGKTDEQLYKAQNNILANFSLRTRELNFLKDIRKFQDLAKEIQYINKYEKISLFYRGYNSEGRYYGNVQNLLQYAEIRDSDLKYAPIVSHQDCFPLFSVGMQYRNAVIFPGEYYKKVIHKHFPYIPVFSVGPYIHYAKGIYSREEIECMKQQNGKTLLVYMPHSIENVDREFSKRKFIDDLLLEYGTNFKKIFLCVYWADVNDPICGYAIEKGMDVVCAGFRFDAKFNRRQRSLLELADAVVFGDIGTFISYALYFKKPVGRIDISNNSTISEKEFTSEWERKIQFNDEFNSYCHNFYCIFSNKLSLNDDMYRWLNPLNGFDQIKKPKEVKEIIEISKDIIEESNDRLDVYDKAVKNVLLKYRFENERKYNILRGAVDEKIYWNLEN